MRSRKLKLFNGRWGRGEHAYVAAYSQADCIAIMREVAGGGFFATELRVYWSHGCWGTSMDGITPERGMWVQNDRYGHGDRTPRRVFPKPI